MFIKFKKAFALILMLIFALPLLARADNNSDYSITKATMGGINQGSGDYSAWVTNDGTGSIFKFARDTGIHYPYVTPASTSQTLTAYQSGSTFVVNNGGGTATGSPKIQLPTAIQKEDYTIITDVALAIRIVPATGEIINYSSDVANSRVKNTSAAIGDSIELFCATTGQWSIKSKSGTWATDNTGN